MGIRKKEVVINYYIKGNTSSFHALQHRLMRNSRKTVPAHSACHSSALCRRNTQDHCADQPSDDRAHCNAKGDNKDFQMILADFFEDAVVHSDADSHRKHRMYKIISECWLKKLTGVGLKPESPQKSPRTRASSVNKTIICLLLLNLSAFSP